MQEGISGAVCHCRELICADWRQPVTGGARGGVNKEGFFQKMLTAETGRERTLPEDCDWVTMSFQPAPNNTGFAAPVGCHLWRRVERTALNYRGNGQRAAQRAGRARLPPIPSLQLPAAGRGGTPQPLALPLPAVLAAALNRSSAAVGRCEVKRGLWLLVLRRGKRICIQGCSSVALYSTVCLAV